jgi:hypothetical protein
MEKIKEKNLPFFVCHFFRDLSFYGADCTYQSNETSRLLRGDTFNGTVDKKQSPI